MHIQINLEVEDGQARNRLARQPVVVAPVSSHTLIAA
jgi:hypothetical protein